MNNEENEGGFVSHLTELRKRLIHSFIFLIIFFIGCYFFAEHIYGFLVDPYAQAVKDDGSDRRLIFTALQETFLTYLKVSFFTAFFVTCPYILMQIWKFIAPGLYKHEKIAILPYLILTPILFFLGGMLVYYLIMPLAIKFFLSFESTGLSTSLPIQLEAKVNEYLSLVMKLIFAFGISFQLPILLNLLERIGDKPLKEVAQIVNEILLNETDSTNRLAALAARVKVLRNYINKNYDNTLNKELRESMDSKEVFEAVRLYFSNILKKYEII